MNFWDILLCHNLTGSGSGSRSDHNGPAIFGGQYVKHSKLQKVESKLG